MDTSQKPPPTTNSERFSAPFGGAPCNVMLAHVAKAPGVGKTRQEMSLVSILGCLTSDWKSCLGEGLQSQRPLDGGRYFLRRRKQLFQAPSCREAADAFHHFVARKKGAIGSLQGPSAWRHRVPPGQG